MRYVLCSLYLTNTRTRIVKDGRGGSMATFHTKHFLVPLCGQWIFYLSTTSCISIYMLKCEFWVCDVFLNCCFYVFFTTRIFFQHPAWDWQFKSVLSLYVFHRGSKACCMNELYVNQTQRWHIYVCVFTCVFGVGWHWFRKSRCSIFLSLNLKYAINMISKWFNFTFWLCICVHQCRIIW